MRVDSRRYVLAAPVRRCARRGYSLLEMLITVLIIQVISVMVVANVSDATANERLDRAANDVIAALRYARMLAMSSGSNQPVGVEFNSSQNYMRVYAGSSYNTVTNSMIPGGVYYIVLGNQRESSNVRISGINLAGTTTPANSVVYSVLGGTSNNGFITLQYGSRTKTVSIPLVGDPKIQ